MLLVPYPLTQPTAGRIIRISHQAKSLGPIRHAEGFVDGETASERLEDLIAHLETLVKSLESEDLDLEKSIQAFEEGVRIARECHRRLDDAERRVEVLRRLPSGEVVSEPFEPERGS